MLDVNRNVCTKSWILEDKDEDMDEDEDVGCK